MTFFRPNENDFLLKQENSHWLYFKNPVEIFTTNTLEDVLPLLDAIQDKITLGFYAAGFLSYEAAPAFDSAFSCHTPNFPLLWFGIYKTPQEMPTISSENSWTTNQSEWRNLCSYPDYIQQIHKIKEYIAAGNTYQVNHTIRFTRPSSLDDSWSFFQHQILPQDALFSAYWRGINHAIASASPELFFQKEGHKITCRPMKGTRPRGETPIKDNILYKELLDSNKDRAENVMILDMIRNDLGQISQPGSVRAQNIFHIESYKTVWQMTSTVESKSHASIVDIFKALFPCSSITGAPKVETMRIIKELENEPRGIYTGCIGYITPEHNARFNVAIRTAAFTKENQQSYYGSGGGIVWDSSAREEWQECITKTAILKEKTPDFILFETLLYTPQNGFTLMEDHLERLQKSALYFNFYFSYQDCVNKLQTFTAKNFHRVRLELTYNGTLTFHATDLGIVLPQIEKPWRIALSTIPICSTDIFLAHKTNKREEYNKRFIVGYDDTIFFNEYGEITESSIANIVVKKDAILHTPALKAGLLPGTFRKNLLKQKIINEKQLYIKDILGAEKMWLINSVRTWIPVDLEQFTKEYSTYLIPQKERK